MSTADPLQATLPGGIHSRFVENVNGLRMHVLEAGAGPSRPCVLLLHGFPELAYTWRKVMLPLAAAGFHVIAPDQRGYGRTTGWDGRYDGDLRSFRMLNLVTDALALVFALGRESVAAVVGHDFGSPVAAWCSLIRPDVFRSVALMSSPFRGPPALPFGPAQIAASPAASPGSIQDALAALQPPRKHYQWYYSSREADDNMRLARQGIHDFLRAYFHHKSADWPGNQPFALAAWTAEELARMPTYYIMERDQGMAETVAPHMPTPQQVASCGWLAEDELRVYSSEFARTGFQGGLQWYRCETSGLNAADQKAYSGRTIDVPSCFMAGRADWGARQVPGALETMQRKACTQMRFCELIPGAGHWVQQEQPEAVVHQLLKFLEAKG
jgi:pimeloyl-ACP methyl ester carboxylesterase